jgi:hypothetical protein
VSWHSTKQHCSSRQRACRPVAASPAASDPGGLLVAGCCCCCCSCAAGLLLSRCPCVLLIVGAACAGTAKLWGCQSAWCLWQRSLPACARYPLHDYVMRACVCVCVCVVRAVSLDRTPSKRGSWTTCWNGSGSDGTASPHCWRCGRCRCCCPPLLLDTRRVLACVLCVCVCVCVQMVWGARRGLQGLVPESGYTRARTETLIRSTQSSVHSIVV